MKARLVKERVESTQAKEWAAELLIAERAARCGDAARALAGTDRILAGDPSHLGALELRAKCQWQLNQHEPLLGTLRTMLTINPYEPGYHALMGSALQCLGRYGEAVQAYERAGDSPGCEEMLADLHAWQARLIAEMVATDETFRAHYRRDPRSACAAHGFRLPEVSTAPVIVGRSERVGLYTRPS